LKSTDGGFGGFIEMHDRLITITVQGGLVTNVEGVPESYDVDVDYKDENENGSTAG